MPPRFTIPVLSGFVRSQNSTDDDNDEGGFVKDNEYEYLPLTKASREFTGDAGVIVFAVGFIAAALR